jgi:acyl-CoA dehydrogenase
VAFGKPVAEQGVTRERIAEARILIDQARLLTLNAAWKMDTVGNKVAKAGDRHDQGGRAQHGLPGDRLGDAGPRRRRRQRRLPAGRAYAHARTLRFADGPDEVHRNAIAKQELARYAGR